MYFCAFDQLMSFKLCIILPVVVQICKFLVFSMFCLFYRSIDICTVTSTNIALFSILTSPNACSAIQPPTCVMRLCSDNQMIRKTGISVDIYISFRKCISSFFQFSFQIDILRVTFYTILHIDKSNKDTFLSRQIYLLVAFISHRKYIEYNQKLSTALSLCNNMLTQAQCSRNIATHTTHTACTLYDKTLAMKIDIFDLKYTSHTHGDDAV